MCGSCRQNAIDRIYTKNPKKSGKITQIFEIQTIGHSFLELDERRSEIGK